MFTSSLAAFFVLAPLVLAQGQNTTLGLQAIKAHFTQSALVPDLFSSFDPTALLSINFAGVGELQPGQALTKEQAGPYPKVSVTSANALSGTYTLAMVDAEAVGSKLPEGQTRHWLVNGVTVSGSDISNKSAVAITQYAGPWPAAGSGPHRYVVVLYDQPSSFAAPSNLSTAGVAVGPFFWTDYVKNSHLGALVAATYFTVQEGTSTASISTTSAVSTQTLPAASGSKSGTATGTGSNPTKTGGADAVTLSTRFYAFAAAMGVFLIAL